MEGNNKIMWKPDLIDDIEEFHKRYNLDYRGYSRHLSSEEKEFRARCLLEEVQEYIQAKTLTEELDAIIDLIYFALGTSYRHGFDFYDGWKEVHRANMSKVRVKKKRDSKRNFGLDVIKPKGWKPPNLNDALNTVSSLERMTSSWKGYYATKRKTLTDSQTEQLIKDGYKLPPSGETS